MAARVGRRGLGVAPQHGVEGAADLFLRSLEVEEGCPSTLRQAPAALAALPEPSRPVARAVRAVIQEALCSPSAMRAAQGRRSVVDSVSSHDNPTLFTLCLPFFNPQSNEATTEFTPVTKTLTCARGLLFIDDF